MKYKTLTCDTAEESHLVDFSGASKRPRTWKETVTPSHYMPECSIELSIVSIGQFTPADP
jgi:hypothetical protein